MKSIKNFFHVIKRFKTASFLNLFGLSVAFASFIVIMMQISFEKQYDQCHLNRDRIFRLEWNSGSDGLIAVVSQPLANALLETSSHVEAMTLFDPSFNTQQVTLHDDAQKKSFKEEFAEVSPDVTKIFTFEWLEGDPNALEKPLTVIIPQSVAQRMFPEGSAIGKKIDTEATTYEVGAVYKDIPKNSTIKNKIYYPFDKRHENTSWGNANHYVYVMFDDASSTEGFLEALVDHINLSPFGYDDKEELRANVHTVFRLNPLPNLYYTNDVKYVFVETGNRQTSFLLMCVAIVVILIAGINFTNFTTALTPMRIKSINTQKILGSTQGTLRRSLLMEGVLISVISFIVAIAVVYACKGSFIDRLIAPGISFSGNGPIFLFGAILSLLTGALAGLYPAFYMTSFDPAMVLKGSFGLSMKGKKLRTVLLCIQYLASISLLVIATFLILQNRHMVKSNYGYDNHQILTMEVGENVLNRQDAFINELKQSEAIEEVAFAFAYLSNMDDCPSWGRSYRGNQIQFNCFLITKDIIKVLGVELTEGHDFLESDHLEHEQFIFNQMAKDQFDLDLEYEANVPIAGFMPNIVYSSLRSPMAPMAFLLMQKEGSSYFPLPLNICYVRMKEGPYYQMAKEHMERVLKNYDPTFPTQVQTLDYHIEDAYQAEKNVSSLVTLFGIISILISVVGIYGLVVFETEYKRREIGVRKVFGSTTGEIMERFNLRYMWMILICTVVAIPISFYFVEKWLTRFTSRIPLYWWVFVAAFLFISLLTLVTTSWQNYKAASTNPVDSLKSE